METKDSYDILFRDQADSLLAERIIRYGDTSEPRNHFHNHLEIYYLISGNRTFFIQDRNYHLRAGDLVVVSPGVVHRTYCAGEDPVHERIVLEVYKPMLEKILNLFNVHGAEKTMEETFGILRLNQADQKRAEGWIGDIICEMQKRQYGYETVIRCILAQLLAFIIRSLTHRTSGQRLTGEKGSGRMTEVAEYISAHSEQKLRLDEIAEHFFISKYHLCRSFKQATGMTLAQYLNSSRIARAKELLLNTGSSITAIAEETGFESSTHFGKVFKQYMGMPPLAYRKTFRGGETGKKSTD